MQVMRSSTGKKRQMVYVPEVNASSFLFFFERSGSWSLRDYSVPHTVRETRPGDLGWSAEMVRRKTRHSFDAPTIDTSNLAHWHEYTRELNREVLHGGTPIPAEAGTLPPAVISTAQKPAGYAVVNREELGLALQRRRASEPGRMVSSANSEDWVTWNVLNLLPVVLGDGWWEHVVTLARRANPDLERLDLGHAPPSIEFWLRVASPADYEAASRARMRASTDPGVRDRSQNPSPVEGETEIDVAFLGRDVRIFVEAKLGSDISLRTTYDPERNQVARNIDCLIESDPAGTGLFWMFVRDTQDGRAYMQILDEYRRSPAGLARLVPHRDPEVLQRVLAGLAIIKWRDLAQPILDATDLEYPEFPEVREELARRI